MIRTAPPSYDRATQQVEDMMDQDIPFSHVEDAIETGHAPEERKAALWLLAWSLREPSVQRREARLILRSVRALSYGGPR